MAYGGALAIGVGDNIAMLKHAIYSVISPEGCASILWRSAEKAEDAADAMSITSERLQELGLIDDIIDEPMGGAHRDYNETAGRIKAHLLAKLNELQAMDKTALVERRYQRIRDYGFFEE